MPIDVDRGYRPGIVDAEGNIIVSQPNAGCCLRYTTEGIAVFMYWNEPGRYYSEHGHEVPEALAAMANYPVEEMRWRRQKQEAMAAAGMAIEAEYQNLGTERKEVLVRGDYTLLEIAGDRYNIELKGEVINPAPMGKDVAMRVLDKIEPPTTVKK